MIYGCKVKFKDAKPVVVLKYHFVLSSIQILIYEKGFNCYPYY